MLPAEVSAGLSFLSVAESVDLNVICKNCGSEVSPYITECPYCGQRLRKRAPKLSRQEEGGAVELAPVTKKRFRRRRQRRERAERPLTWLAAERPYVTAALVLAGVVVYLVNQAGPLGYFDLGAVVGPLDGDWWRLVAAQFNYDNVGYMFAVGVAVAIFGTSLERRYSGLATATIFLACGALGFYLATVIESFPLAIGGNGSALGLVGAWLVRDIRDRQAGYDTESDLLGVAAISAVLLAMPLLDRWADVWVGFGGGALGCLIGAMLPERR
jgi:membrane associated rhomboid family serine protease